MSKNLITLETSHLRITVSNYGARLVSLELKAKNGNWVPLCAGFSNLNLYEQSDFQYFGATVGPVAGRLAKGKFTLGETSLQLETNEGENFLHGGEEGGLHNKVWTVIEQSERHVRFGYSISSGIGGFPGNLSIQAEYLVKGSSLEMTLSAETDSMTPLSLTNHSYWNLSGEGASASSHELRINAGSYIPIDRSLIPTGVAKPVQGTSFDFKSQRLIGVLDTSRTEPEPGFDHTYLLDPASTLREVAVLFHPVSEITMQVFSDAPAIQLYTGNRNPTFLESQRIPVLPGNTVCLEAFGVNNPEIVGDYPSILITPEKPFKRVIVHEFFS